MAIKDYDFWDTLCNMERIKERLGKRYEDDPLELMKRLEINVYDLLDKCEFEVYARRETLGFCDESAMGETIRELQFEE